MGEQLSKTESEKAEMGEQLSKTEREKAEMGEQNEKLEAEKAEMGEQLSKTAKENAELAEKLSLSEFQDFKRNHLDLVTNMVKQVSDNIKKNPTREIKDARKQLDKLNTEKQDLEAKIT